MARRIAALLLGILVAFGLAGPVRAAEPETSLTADELHDVDRAIGFMDSGKLKRAIRIMEGLARKHPDDSLVLHELTYAYRAAGRSADAVALLAPHEAQLPEDTLAAYCSALDEAGRNADAIAATRRALERFPRSGLLHSTLGTSLANAGQLEDAMAAYTAGMVAEPTWPSNYLRATQLSARMGSPAMAIVWGETFCHLEGARCTQALSVIAEVYAERIHLALRADGSVDFQARLAEGPARIEVTETATTMDMAHAIELSTMVGGVGVAAAPPSLMRVHALRLGLLAAGAGTGSQTVFFDVELFQWLTALRDAGHLEAYDYILFGEIYPAESMAYQDTHGAEIEAMMRYLERHPFVPSRAVLPGDKVRVDIPAPAPVPEAPAAEPPTEAAPQP